MPKPHPSLALVFNVDESLATKENRLEVGRCFGYVACTCVLRARPSGDTGGNTIGFLVQGNQRYLHSSDEGADELWDDVIERWLYNQFYNLSNNLQIYNRRQREIEGDELVFDWLDVNLQGGELVCRLRLDSRSAVDPEASGAISQVRDALNSGALGEGVKRVVMPSAASYDAQREAGLAAKAQREAEAEEAAAAEAEQEAVAEQEARQAAEQSFTEDEALTDEPVEDELARIERENEEKYSLQDADFDIDYTVWDVEYADGTLRTYDSAAGAFTGQER